MYQACGEGTDYGWSYQACGKSTMGRAIICIRHVVKALIMGGDIRHVVMALWVECQSYQTCGKDINYGWIYQACGNGIIGGMPQLSDMW